MANSLKQHDLEAGLRQLGLRRGDVVEVHSSLSSFGHVEGGAATVVDALMSVVGADGTILMSAYPVTPALPLSEADIARGLTWKVRILPEGSTEKTGLGAVVAEFKKRPGVVLGIGLHRVAAWGQEAETYAREGYQRLLEADGWALLLGVGIDRLSSMHQAEEVPLPERITACFRIPEDILRDYPEDAWGVGYGGTPGDAWGKVWQTAESQGMIHHGLIGQADCKLFKARAVVDIYRELRQKDPFGLFGVLP